MRSHSNHLLFGAIPLLLSACGGESSDAVGFDLEFRVTRQERSLACSEVPEIRSARVTVFRADGVTVMPAWPKSADCASGALVDRTVPAGDYVIEVAALGELAGESDVVLFKARREVTLPSSEPIIMSLMPEVAFLTISWSFKTLDNLGPCEEEIGRIALYVSTGAAGPGSYNNLDLGCDQGPFELPTPFLPQRYTVRLEAYSELTGRLLYTFGEDRLLERGENPPFHAIFQPIGGRLIFDWRFAVRGAIYQACNDPQVGASEVLATVQNRAGDEPFISPIACDTQRPHALQGVRYTQGQELDIELAAEGVERFYAAQALRMPQGDADLGMLTLQAVGSATVAFTVTASSACAGGVAGFDVTLSDPVTQATVVENRLGPMERSLPLADVPFGEYRVRIAGTNGPTVICETSGLRTIEGRSSVWDPFAL